LIVIIIALFLLFSNPLSTFSNKSALLSNDMAFAESASFGGRGISPSVSQDFAPEVEERIITKTASLSTEIERGDFHESEAKLKAIIESSDSFILNQNVNKHGTKKNSYFSGSYQIKVEVSKYDSIVSQLKEIGEVQSFNENVLDITGGHTNLQIELDTEKARLKRFNVMLNEAKEISDKIELNDRTFNQERRVKFLEDSLENVDQRVQYSTLHLSITEKQSEYANIVFVKFSEITRTFVNNLNSLIKLFFSLIPWVIAITIIYYAYRRFKK
jgi:hypothetical protein